MLLQTTIAVAICGGILVSLPASGQESPISKAEFAFEASIPFVVNTSAYGAKQTAEVNYGFLGGYHFVFHKNDGARLSWSYAHKPRAYNLIGGSLGLTNDFDEVLAVGALRSPANRWSPFVLAGADALLFDPTTLDGEGTQNRLGYLYGSNADSILKHRIPPTERRGTFFNSATFNLNGLERFTERAEPSVVLGYSF
jgi:hypothetical protein